MNFLTESLSNLLKEKKDEKEPFKSPTVIPGINKKDIIHK